MKARDPRPACPPPEPPPAPSLGLLVALLAWSVWPTPAEAHVVGLSYADITLEERAARVTLRVPTKGLAEHFELPVEGEPPTGAEVLAVGGDALAAFFPGKVEIINEDRACAPSPPALQPDDDPGRIRVEFAFACETPVGDDVGIYLYFFNEFGPNHSTLATIRRGQAVKEFVFTQRRTDFRWSPRLWAQAGGFLLLGVEHIFTGYDHILFLIGLMVIWRGSLNIVKIVTSFTVAHSITLILAALSVVTLPTRLVESVIALSIAYVGIENLVVKEIRRRWLVAFVFGLVHGFGFAEILREMGLPSQGLILSLLSFNVGVEIGQLVVVAACVPLIYAASRGAHQRILVRGASAAIFLMGMLWFTERALLGL
ncbi:MAG: HupE/UreJ family protein [Candidatus Rokubacteria bacterium]|nr:HupE/UreJ family protein [Candidatus Rokubacteria bacterium]